MINHIRVGTKINRDRRVGRERTYALRVWSPESSFAGRLSFAPASSETLKVPTLTPPPIRMHYPAHGKYRTVPAAPHNYRARPTKPLGVNTFFFFFFCRGEGVIMSYRSGNPVPRFPLNRLRNERRKTPRN